MLKSYKVLGDHISEGSHVDWGIQEDFLHGKMTFKQNSWKINGSQWNEGQGRRGPGRETSMSKRLEAEQCIWGAKRQKITLRFTILGPHLPMKSILFHLVVKVTSSPGCLIDSSNSPRTKHSSWLFLLKPVLPPMFSILALLFT